MGSSEHDDGNFGLHKMQAMRLSKNTVLAVPYRGPDTGCPTLL
jgi:hypothetical protein